MHGFDKRRLQIDLYSRILFPYNFPTQISDNETLCRMSNIMKSVRLEKVREQNLLYMHNVSLTNCT